MLFLLLGIVLLTMRLMEFGPVATWSWLVVLAPFAFAMMWWAWADATGYSKRKVMEQEDARKAERIRKNHEAMGTLNSKKRR